MIYIFVETMKKYLIASIITIGMSIVPVIAAESYSIDTSEVNDFDVENAMKDMENLKNNLDEVIQKLYELDEKERGEDNSISEKYRATRTEIVNVIQTINQTTENITEQLQKIVTYKKLMLRSYKELQASRS